MFKSFRLDILRRCVRRVTYGSCLVDLRAEREDGNDDDGGGVVRVLVDVPQHHTEHLEDVERVETLKQ